MDNIGNAQLVCHTVFFTIHALLQSVERAQNLLPVTIIPFILTLLSGHFIKTKSGLLRQILLLTIFSGFALVFADLIYYAGPETDSLCFFWGKTVKVLCLMILPFLLAQLTDLSVKVKFPKTPWMVRVLAFLAFFHITSCVLYPVAIYHAGF